MTRTQEEEGKSRIANKDTKKKKYKNSNKDKKEREEAKERKTEIEKPDVRKCQGRRNKKETKIVLEIQ